VHIHPQIVGSADRSPTLADFGAAQREEAEVVLGIVEQLLPHIRHARDTSDEYRVAILVRARRPSCTDRPLFSARGEFHSAPSKSSTSRERQELLDLRALTHALSASDGSHRVAFRAARRRGAVSRFADLHLLTRLR